MKTLEVPLSEVDLGVISTGENVGFSTIPDQLMLAAASTGFHTNILVIGRRGLGASTLINSLFSVPLVDKARGNELTVSTNEIYENGVKLDTVIVTYHGEDVDVVLDYLDKKNMEYFESEHGLKAKITDERVYACIFLLPLDENREKDVEMMAKISRKCNLIPVLPKADTFTSEELTEYKHKILKALKNSDVDVYFPAMTDGFDQELAQEAYDIVQKYPLAISASESIYEYKGGLIRGRKYKWGFVDVANEDVSDFSSLRKILICTFLEDLIYHTEVNFYERFKRTRISDANLANEIETKAFEHLWKDMSEVCIRECAESEFDVLAQRSLLRREGLGNPAVDEPSGH